ncbi:MAG: CDP-diacylglycerol--serine O-phosphatidyltransferase [Gemmatimonadales bacterium]
MTPTRPKTGIRRVVVVVPSAFTLGNLFFGFWSIVSAFNGNFRQASWFIFYAAILDMLDGRVARMSKTGSRFGAELDSLVDVISFGVAPALLMYLLELSTTGRFGWVVCYLYVVAATLRLARYNVLAATKPTPGWFVGMPSPSAGMTLAAYYPFSQTEWYRRSVAYLDLEHQGLVFLILLLAVLMVSKVMYPRNAPVDLRTTGGVIGLVLQLGILVGAVIAPSSVLFPVGVAYMTFGILRHFILTLISRDEPATAGGGTP